MQAVHPLFDFDNCRDVAIWAAGVTALSGLMRGREVAIDAKAHGFNSGKDATLAGLESLGLEGAWHFKLTIPWSKTSPTGATILLHSKKEIWLDPTRALLRHFNLNGNRILSNSPIFSYTSDSAVQLLTMSEVVIRFNELWVPLGHPKISNHCFRIGGLLLLLMKVVGFEMARMQGRWASKGSFSVYLRKHAEVMAVYLEVLEMVLCYLPWSLALLLPL